ncbi:L-seryl-tRNA(Sec) selenium transferase [Anaerobranca gottschalkii]|uniref:L-seryl-tRNA(Sec) selenium transferase n=1 Tax=Anaerobranca gottschalkii DSM 13577 TaxID=1120990 RepID=A0A1I0BM07_9FIRM|nr:L-seryl-tRNA(Sec) selenium transferase [Anaerobranca gottschalkii]SET07304.1 L-seryl-tRNA(Sec) selenium transferase [Anaerobranca gottschalkii DSM 13577]
MENLLRQIPSVTKLLETKKGKELIEIFGREEFLRICREKLGEIREFISSQGKVPMESLEEEKILLEIEKKLKLIKRKSLTKVINCTGTILHTNLGRAPLAANALEKILEVSRGYSNLEFDLERGERGSRTLGIREQLAQLLGVDDCVIVNNNAGAVLLVLSALTKGKEVIISRGQLVEIGGSFRIPEIMEQSGSILKEVGTTNKVHLKDYQRAINENTGAIMRVHTSNYRIVGFTQDVDLQTLSKLAHENNLPLIDDLGSGTLIDLIPWGIYDEPTVTQSIKMGADVVTFSGDKLLGGPQCGIIVGKREYIDIIKKHPMMRALRCDKLVLSALGATLELYQKGEIEKIPIYAFLHRPVEELKGMAKRLTENLAKEKFIIKEDHCYVGGGALPTHELPTVVIKLNSQIPPHDLAQWFRNLEIPVIGRIHKGEFYLDLKGVFPEDIPYLQEVLSKL